MAEGMNNTKFCVDVRRTDPSDIIYFGKSSSVGTFHEVGKSAAEAHAYARNCGYHLDPYEYTVVPHSEHA